MKKELLLAGLLLVLSAPAMANGLSLAWGTECWGLATVQNNLMTFACDSNTSPADWSITASFTLDQATDVAVIDTYLEMVFEGSSIPSWWLRSVATDCNYGTGANAVHSSAYLGTGCNEIFGAGVIGGGGYGYLVPGIQIQMEGIWATAAVPNYVTIPAGAETFADMVTLKNANTVGAGACAGCAVGGVLGLHHMILTTPTGDVTVPPPYTGNRCLVWQHPFAGQPCNSPVPTRNTTWGQVKSLYR